MAVFAQGLPVAFIPEEVFIPAVRKDMVHNRGRHEFAIALALYAQGILPQVSFPGRPPSGVITTICGAFPCIQRTMLSAIYIIRQSCATRMPAGTLGFSWHSLSLQDEKSPVVVD